jgi:hypothetical protein
MIKSIISFLENKKENLLLPELHLPLNLREKEKNELQGIPF